MENPRTTVLRTRLRLLGLVLLLSALTPPRLWAAPAVAQRGERLAGDLGGHRTIPAPQAADRAEAGRGRAASEPGDSSLRHAAPQGPFQAGDAYVPSDQDVRLWYPPGARRPLWGY
jgi:hypothetical protein